MSSAVELINVDKYFGLQPILTDLNLVIKEGEFIAVVGPSGCGKSTLLRLIAGLDTVSHGSILINGQCVNHIPAAQRNMAMVFQNYALYPHMTVFNNIAYSLKMRKIPPEEIRQRVEEVAEMLQISECLSRKPQSLSGGQRQRVAMGRAMVRSPSVFLFDEALSNLDIKLRFEMRQEIKKIHQQLKTTFIYVTHDQAEALTLANRVLVLNKGKIEQIDSPQNIYHQPASLFVADFTGLYPINLWTAKLDIHAKKVITSFGAELPWLSLSNPEFWSEEVIIAIRPEDLQLSLPGETGLDINIRWIDDIGADKLVYAHTHCGKEQLIFRMSGDKRVNQQATIALPLTRANIFNKKTGIRLGGWDEKRSTNT